MSRRNPFFKSEAVTRVNKLISKYIGYVAVYYEGNYYSRFYIQRTYRDLSFELLRRASQPSTFKRYYFQNIKKVGVTLAPLIFGDYFASPYSPDVALKLVGYIDIQSDLFADIRIYFPLSEDMPLHKSYDTRGKQHFSPVILDKRNPIGKYSTMSYKKYWRLNQIYNKNW